MKLAESGPEEARPESVTEFTRRVKELLEGGIGSVWVRGEISNLRVQASGHAYFSLKDSGAQLKAVLFRGNAARQTVRLRDGLQVVVFGEASVYEARRVAAEQHRLQLRAGILEREIRVPARLYPQVGNFAAQPDGPDAALEQFLHAPRELRDALRPRLLRTAGRGLHAAAFRRAR